VISRLLPAETLLFAGEHACAGTFTCRPDDPLFRAEAPSTAHCIVFSRTAVWIRHEHGARYVADPTVATFHNRGRVYRRWRIAEDGDRCDWIAYADDLVADAVSRFDRGRGRDPLWFPREFQPISTAMYARQRRLFDRIGGPASIADHDPQGIEEAAILLLADVLSAAEPEPDAPRRAEFEAVQHVRAAIASSPPTPRPLRALARLAAMTPFHLCRAFRRVFGETMTSYRLRLRLMASLERLRACEPLTEIALAHGFSSHSHYSAAFRAAFGVTPSMWRKNHGGHTVASRPRSLREP
jgi:AraC family transcriptional regulator